MHTNTHICIYKIWITFPLDLNEGQVISAHGLKIQVIVVQKILHLEYEVSIIKKLKDDCLFSAHFSFILFNYIWN